MRSLHVFDDYPDRAFPRSTRAIRQAPQLGAFSIGVVVASSNYHQLVTQACAGLGQRADGSAFRKFRAPANGKQGRKIELAGFALPAGSFFALLRLFYALAQQAHDIDDIVSAFRSR